MLMTKKTQKWLEKIEKNALKTPKDLPNKST